MNKERIDIGSMIEEQDINLLDDLEGFNIIKEKQVGFDGEKGFCHLETVIQRKSDNKYFLVEWTDYGHGRTNLEECEAIEVFKKEKTIVTYE